jgi:hypothetical protein
MSDNKSEENRGYQWYLQFPYMPGFPYPFPIVVAGSRNRHDAVGHLASDGTATVQGTQSNSLNVFATDNLPSGKAGDSPQVSSNGGYLSFIGVNAAHSSNVFPLFVNTVEHEFIHQFNGDTQGPNMDPFSYVINEFAVDGRAQMMGWVSAGLARIWCGEQTFYSSTDTR